MSRVFVPISGRHYVDDERVLADLKKMGASRVYMSIGERFPFEKGERRDKILATIKEKNQFYTSRGIECSAWMDTLGFGGGSAYYNQAAAKGYTRIKSIIGRELDDAFCPLDSNFTEMMCELVRDICRTGIKMIMLDDELTLTARPGIGCACELHLMEYRRRLGEDIDLSEIAEKAFMGGPNNYRRAWLELMSDTMRSFCQKLRAAVDDVDPTIRMGFCAGYTSWELDGLDAIGVAETLAGKTKPFLRFSGAPYWVANRRFGRQPISSIVEFSREQNLACRDHDIEVFTEIDCYPRDRYRTPAAYSECLHLGTLAADGTDTMKYVYEYGCQPDYDAGYVKAHVRNAELYKDVEKTFGGKTAAGVRIYNQMKKIAEAELPRICGRPFDHADEKQITCMIFNCEEKLLTANTIPTTYEGQGICGITFGENARYLPDSAFEKGLILDAKAAMILEKRGIDTGLSSCKKTPCRFMELYGDNRYCHIEDTGHVCLLTPKKGAVAVGHYVPSEMYTDEKHVSSYTYENCKGQRFLVYGFDAELLKPSSSLFWSYEKGRSLSEIIPWLGGEELPVTCLGNPLLYQICKVGNGDLAAAFINCHEDEIFDAELKLSKPALTARFIGCEGEIINEKLLKIKNIKSFGFAGVEVALKNE